MSGMISMLIEAGANVNASYKMSYLVEPHQIYPANANRFSRHESNPVNALELVFYAQPLLSITRSFEFYECLRVDCALAQYGGEVSEGSSRIRTVDYQRSWELDFFIRNPDLALGQ